MITKPLGLHIERRREVEDVGVARLDEVRQAVLGDHEGSSDVNLVHEVVPLHVKLESSCQVDGRGIVDEDIYSAESIDNLLNALLDALLVPDVTLQRESLSACLLDLFRRGVDGSWVVKTVPGNLGWGVVVLARMAMLAPSCAHLSPMAKPMPREAPVMTIVLPARGLRGQLLIWEEMTDSLFMRLT